MQLKIFTCANMTHVLSDDWAAHPLHIQTYRQGRKVVIMWFQGGSSSLLSVTQLLRH